MIDPELIVPGERVGQVALGMTLSQVEQAIGKPSHLDRPTGTRDARTWSTYKHLRLTVGFSQIPEVAAFGIWTENERHRTREGVGVGTSGSDVVTAFGADYERTQHEEFGGSIQTWYGPLGISFMIALDNFVRRVHVFDPRPS